MEALKDKSYIIVKLMLIIGIKIFSRVNFRRQIFFIIYKVGISSVMRKFHR